MMGGAIWVPWPWRQASKQVYDNALVKKAFDALEGSGSESLCKLYKSMLSGSPDRFVVKPSRLEDLTPLYDAMPNFKSALDEIKRQIALAASSSDDLDVMPMLIWGDPGIGKTKFAKEVAKMISTGFSMCPMSSLTAGWIFSGASSQWKSAKPGAEILRGKRFIDFFERNLSPMAFIQQLRFERAPSGVEDALSHRGFEQLGGRHPTTMTPSF